MEILEGYAGALEAMAEKAATKKPSFFGMFINFFAKKTVTKSA